MALDRPYSAPARKRGRVESHIVHEIMIRKLETRAPLEEADKDMIRALPFVQREVEAGTYLVREGTTPQRCAFVLSGYAFRQKLTSDGARQILAVMLPGDFVDFQNLFLSESDHNVQALTRTRVAELATGDLRQVFLASAAISKAINTDALIESAIFREWILNIGRRDGRSRIGHLLCEFALRLRAAGIAASPVYEFPMTQEQLGDAVGLTSVHVSRILKGLALEGLVERRGRFVRILDWEGLRDASDFNENYLHFRQLQPA